MNSEAEVVEKTEELDDYLENHYIPRSNWLRAAVLGANDGILSTSHIAIGVAAANSTRDHIILASPAGLVAMIIPQKLGQ